MGEVSVESGYCDIGIDERRVLQGIVKAKTTLGAFDIVDRVNGVIVVLRPVHTAHVPLSANYDPWPLDKWFLVSANNTAGTINGKCTRNAVVLFKCLPILQCCYIAKRLPLPPLGYAVFDFDVFVAGESL